jgi:hypothetical protein
MPKVKEHLFFIAKKLLMLNWHMGWLKRKLKKLFNIFIIFQLLQRGRPMQEYESLRPLFEILAKCQKSTKNIRMIVRN